jgi:hypothetical protein
MTEADDAKNFINLLFRDGVDATVRGASAHSEINSAITRLEEAKSHEEWSIVYASQQRDFLDLIIEKTRFLLTTTGNMSLMQALGNFEAARQELTDYMNRMRIQMNELEKLQVILQYARRDQELLAAETKIRAGMAEIESYRAIL